MVGNQRYNFGLTTKNRVLMLRFERVSQNGFGVLLFVFIAFMPSFLVAQQDNYMGKEKQITITDLEFERAKLKFDEALSMQIFQDEKNTYFAVDASKLASRYEKLRLIDLTYGDKYLVNIGSNPAESFFYFLVNNTILEEVADVKLMFEEYAQKAKDELNQMTTDELNQWLAKHDKY